MNSDLDLQHLTNQLQRWDGRRRLRDMLIWAPRGMLAGLLLSALVATLARLRPLLTTIEVAYVAAGLVLLGLLVSAIVLLAQSRTPAQQARFADRQFKLQERVSTALEIHSGALQTTRALARQQLADTLAAANRVDARSALPLAVNRRDWLVIAAAVALLVAAILLPNPQADLLLKQRALSQSIAEQIEALEALQEEIIQNPDLTEEQRADLLQPIEQALQGLQAGDLNREEVVAVLSEAEASLRALGNDFNTDNLRRALQDAGQPLAQNPASQALGQALQSGNLAQAGSAAAQLADRLPELSPAEQVALAQSLAQAAAALQEIDSALAGQLARAAEALQNGDVAAAQQALREAAATLQQRAQQAAAAQQAQAAANQLGQGRREVAQAGQPGQGQADQPGEGPPGTGTGEGQGDGPGNGQGLGDADANAEGVGVGSEEGEGLGGPGPGGGHAENVFVPDFLDLSSIEGTDVELPAECIANPASCGLLIGETPTEFTPQGSQVPYSQVFGDYRNAAYEALAEDYIPLGLKGYIRDYFSSLEP